MKSAQTAADIQLLIVRLLKEHAGFDWDTAVPLYSPDGLEILLTLDSGNQVRIFLDDLKKEDFVVDAIDFDEEAQ